MERAGTGRNKRRIALEIHYDGSCFNGWQIQNGGRTVQGEIEKALEILTREKVRIIASGRTDAGVHSLGQVAHFDCFSKIELKRLCTGLNGILEHDVSINNTYFVPDQFHARYSAVWREYKYLIYNHPQRTPFMRYRAMWVQHPLNIEYLRKAASFLIGEKDYKTFCKKTSSDCNTKRKIDLIEINRNEKLIEIKIRANAFLHNMIRIIVGTLCEMHKRKDKPEFVIDILNKKDRMYGGITAPPHGLYLQRVSYDPELSTMESAF